MPFTSPPPPSPSPPPPEPAPSLHLHLDRTALPHFKLVYFDERGRAEVIRLLFAAAQVPYEDVRLPLTLTDGKPRPSKEWQQLKQNGGNCPFGKLPVLYVTPKSSQAVSAAKQPEEQKELVTEQLCMLRHTDATGRIVIAQSTAIARYLADEFHLFGQTKIERALIDEVLMQTIDWKHATDWGLAGVSKSREQIVHWLKDVYPTEVTRMEAFLQRHGGCSGIVSDHWSLADLALLDWNDLWQLDSEYKQLVNNAYEKHGHLLGRLIERCSGLREIEAYLKQRKPSLP